MHRTSKGKRTPERVSRERVDRAIGKAKRIERLSQRVPLPPLSSKPERRS